MKEINILTEITDFNNKPIENLKFKDILMHQLGSYRSQEGKKTLEVFALGIKIAQYNEDLLSLEEAEYNLLKEIVTSNPAQMAVVIQGRTLLMFKEAERKE